MNAVHRPTELLRSKSEGEDERSSSTYRAFAKQKRG